MAIKDTEPQSTLILGQVDVLVAFLSHELRLPPEHVVHFVAFALMGSWQSQFQVPGKSIPRSEMLQGIMRVARTVAQLFCVSPLRPARFAFDQLQMVAIELMDEHEEWAAAFHTPDTGLLYRAAAGAPLTEFEELLHLTWWELREKYWPKRDARTLHAGIGRALRVLGEPDDVQHRLDVLKEVRNARGNHTRVFIGREGELQIDWRGVRDLISKQRGIPVPRPDRPRRTREYTTVSGSAIGEAPPTHEINADADDVLNLAATLDAAEIARWANATLRTERRTSAKGRILVYLRDNPGTKPPLRELGRRHKLSPAGLSKAWSSLRVSLQAHLSKHGEN